MKRNISNNIFSSFKPQQKGPTKRQQDNIEYAKQLSEKMMKEKKEAREKFMLKLLENAKEINKAREDWEGKEEETNV